GTRRFMQEDFVSWNTVMSVPARHAASAKNPVGSAIGPTTEEAASRDNAGAPTAITDGHAARREATSQSTERVAPASAASTAAVTAGTAGKAGKAGTLEGGKVRARAGEDTPAASGLLYGDAVPRSWSREVASERSRDAFPPAKLAYPPPMAMTGLKRKLSDGM